MAQQNRKHFSRYHKGREHSVTPTEEDLWAESPPNDQRGSVKVGKRMYLSQASESHLPVSLMIASVTPSLAKSVVLPILRLCML